jgi:hypothetical protein
MEPYEAALREEVISEARRQGKIVEKTLPDHPGVNALAYPHHGGREKICWKVEHITSHGITCAAQGVRCPDGTDEAEF